MHMKRLGSLLTQYGNSAARRMSPILPYPQQGAPFSVTKPLLDTEKKKYQAKKDYAIDQLAKWIKKTHPELLKKAVAQTDAQFNRSGVKGLSATEPEPPGWFDSLLDNITKVVGIKSTVELNTAATNLEKARVQAEIKALQQNIDRAKSAEPPIPYPATDIIASFKLPLMLGSALLLARKLKVF